MKYALLGLLSLGCAHFNPYARYVEVIEEPPRPIVIYEVKIFHMGTTGVYRSGSECLTNTALVDDPRTYCIPFDVRLEMSLQLVECREKVRLENEEEEGKYCIR